MQDPTIQSPTHFGKRSVRVLVVMAVLTVVGIAATVVTGVVTERRERDNLLNLAKTAVTAIPPADVRALQGTRADTVAPAYLRLKTIMVRQRAANPDVRFVYLFGQRGDKMYFQVDSEPSNSEDYSAPGDIYEDTTPEELEAFASGQPLLEGPASDEWGEWISALVPIPDPDTGKTISMLGMDIDSSVVNDRVNNAQALPFILTLLALTLLVIYLLFVRRAERTEAARNDFITLAAHQLQTPLYAVAWNAELLLGVEGGPLTDSQRASIAKVLESAKHMRNVVQELLTVARTDAGTLASDPRPTDVTKVADEVITEFGSQIAERRLKIQRRYGMDIRMEADTALIAIILHNLISNAVKYTQHEGTITISISKDNEFVHFAVADTGYGIPANQQSKIFTKLFRADNVRQHDDTSSGIGLYLVKSIVEAHGGKVWFASVEDKGSTFYVDLPASGMRRIS